MENFDEQVIEELRKKAIERSDDDDIEVNEIEDELTQEQNSVELTPEKPKKTKKQRSQKQIEAFEKARIKRAENLKIKKQIEEEKKEAKKAEKEQVKKEIKERLEKKEVLDLPPTEEVDKAVRKYKAEISSPRLTERREPKYREQVIHNYYYYGFSPQQVANQGLTAFATPQQREVSFYDESPKQKKKQKVIYNKKKKVKSPSPEIQSSDSEAEEPQSYKELQNYTEDYAEGTYGEDYEPPVVEQPKLKFRFR